MEVILRVGVNSLCAGCCECLVNAVGGMNQSGGFAYVARISRRLEVKMGTFCPEETKSHLRSK
jgi:hypothetical protein